jgi:DNA-binding NtrC family response regulator
MDTVLARMEDHANLSRAVPSSQAGFGELIGESAPMHFLYDVIGKVSQNTSPVQVIGETKPGKELVARAKHFKGLRREKVFVPVDWSARTATLIESELFGHVRGAFTSAEHSKRGLLQTAHEATIFLDEIGELPMSLQAKLLRTLQEKEKRPVGSTERVPIDVRVIAAINRDLEAGVRAGAFRQDVYFRLNVVQIRLPALREHKVDIPLLVAHFLDVFSDPKQPVRALIDEALRRLMAYDWPGNVREPENAIECALALSSNSVLAAHDLVSAPYGASAPNAPHSNELVPLEELERRSITNALPETGGDKLGTARLLGIGKTMPYRKLRAYATTPAPTRPEPSEGH